MKYKILENINYKKVKVFDIKQNGIQIIEDENKIEIYNDPFRTIPLFITKNENDELIIFSNFEDFYKMDNVDKTIDEAGFWEIVLFGSGLWTRTLYKNVKQMPAASKIVIDKNTNEYKIKRYWDFDIEEDKSIDSIEKAAKGLYDRLDNIFSKLDRDQKYIMGMSGGMDSRITLAFLSKYISKDNIELFTYGFDERLLEYKYACNVAKSLGYNKPKFHKLTTDSYKKAMSYLPQMSGGQIGINHCHIIDNLLSQNYENNIQLISNHYLEVLFNVYGDSTEFEYTLIDNSSINENLKVIIRKDIKKIIKNNQKKRYWYESEKQIKFHSYIDNTYQNLKNISTCDIYRNYELFSFSKTIPNKYNNKKKLQDYILEKYFNLHQNNISSSRFEQGEVGKIRVDKYIFKFLNRANAVLRFLTKGHIQLFNKYQTEEQDRLLYRDFHKDLKDATRKFINLGLMSEEQKQQWDKLPLKSNGIGERYYLISLGRLV